MGQLNKIKYEDRDESINNFRIALSMVGIAAQYEDADLIYQVIKLVEKRKGSTDLRDMTTLQLEWERKWEKYFQEHKIATH